MRKALLIALSVGVILTASAGILYLTNEPPTVPALSAADAADPGKPFVIKLHAQWCPVCMVTKSVWSQVEEQFGSRVKLVVFDFTTQADTDASRAEAARLGLDRFFEEFSGATGLVVILDGRTREVRSVVTGSRDFEAYRTAIVSALSDAQSLRSKAQGLAVEAALSW